MAKRPLNVFDNFVQRSYLASKKFAVYCIKTSQAQIGVFIHEIITAVGIL